MFDIIARFINFYLITHVAKPLSIIRFKIANFHIVYRNVHESLNSAFARFLMPVVFPVAVLLDMAINIAFVCANVVMLPLFMITHCLPVLVLTDRVGILPWLSYSTCLDGKYANDLEFIRDNFQLMQIEMVGFKLHPIVELLIIRVKGDTDVYSYILFGSVSDLNDFLMRMQEEIDKENELM